MDFPLFYAIHHQGSSKMSIQSECVEYSNGDSNLASLIQRYSKYHILQPNLNTSPTFPNLFIIDTFTGFAIDLRNTTKNDELFYATYIFYLDFEGVKPY